MTVPDTPPRHWTVKDGEPYWRWPDVEATHINRRDLPRLSDTAWAALVAAIKDARLFSYVEAELDALAATLATARTLATEVRALQRRGTHKAADRADDLTDFLLSDTLDTEERT